jgi:hypothetical protein
LFAQLICYSIFLDRSQEIVLFANTNCAKLYTESHFGNYDKINEVEMVLFIVLFNEMISEAGFEKVFEAVVDSKAVCWQV